MLVYNIIIVSQTKEAIMSKNSRKYTARLNKTSFDPNTGARAREDLRSTERPHENLKEERPAGHRGSIDENQS